MNDLVMTWGRHWDGGGWGGPWWGLAFLTFVALIAGTIIYVDRRRPTPSVAAPNPQASAEQLLAERFARGEIDDDEFQARRTVIRAHRPE